MLDLHRFVSFDEGIENLKFRDHERVTSEVIEETVHFRPRASAIQVRILSAVVNLNPFDAILRSLTTLGSTP
jgi:hypothetical protein